MVKTIATLAAFIGSSTAFQAPAVLGARKSAIRMLDIEAEPGILDPTGFFDPAGFSADKEEGQLRWFQEAELKHGRVAMLASLGFLVGESFHPLFGGDIDVPSYIAFQATPLQTFWPIVLLGLGAIELTTAAKSDGIGVITEDRVPGDIGFDPLSLSEKFEFSEIRTKELQNGRLAMIGIAGMVVQELVSADKIF